MPGNGSLVSPVDPAAACCSVGRVANNEIKGFRGQKSAGLSRVALDNVHPVRPLIGLDIFLSKPGQASLDFQAGQGNILVQAAQDQTNNATAATKIKYAVTRPNRAEMGQEYGIHGKAVAVPVLLADQPAIEQRIRGYLLRVLVPALTHPRLSVC
jgi:hypothetical protein